MCLSAKINEWIELWKKQAARMYGEQTKFFESHAHYNLDNYKNFREQILDIIHESGVSDCIIPAISFKSNKDIKNMFDFPKYSWIKYAIGIHPKYVCKEELDSKRLEELSDLIEDSKCVAIGECGLDYSYQMFDVEHRALQIKLFELFIDKANDKNLPMILHVRPAVYQCEYNATKDALDILNGHRILNGAVLHCFCGNCFEMKAYLEAGVSHFGIGGRICYGNTELEKAVKNMPQESILLETDSPYIKLESGTIPNTSLSLFDIAAKIAEIRGTSVERIAEITYCNALRLFDMEGR